MIDVQPLGIRFSGMIIFENTEKIIILKIIRVLKAQNNPDKNRGFTLVDRIP
jgi:hypothetical protein